MSILKHRSYLIGCALAICLLLICAGCTEAESKSVFLYAEPNTFEVTNAKGDCLSSVEGQTGGDIEVLSTVSQSDSVSIVEIPYSDSFTFANLGEGDQSYGVNSDMDRAVGDFFQASGKGMETIEIAPSGQIALSGDDFSFSAFGTLRCEELGDLGCVTIRSVSAGSALIRFDAENSTISFEGLSTEFTFLTIGGKVEAREVDLKLTTGSGVIDFSDIANGVIAITEDGDTRTISL